MIIYGLIDGNTLELRYVGQTIKTPEARLTKHYHSNRNPHLYNWLRSTNVNVVVLERDPVDLDEAERRWISDMRAQGALLLNITDGGGGTLGHQHTPATRIKMSIAKRGVKRCPPTVEVRAKISAGMRGKQNMLGRKHTTETKIKMSAAALAFHFRRKTAARIEAFK